MIKLFLSIVTAFTLLMPVNAKTLIPGGESCGVNLKYNGVLITGSYAFFDEKNNRYLNENTYDSGELIIACNDDQISTTDDLIKSIQKCIQNNKTIYVTTLYNNQITQKELDVVYDETSNTFKTGLYINDHISAIGTITYYDPDSNTYGAFGHSIEVNNDCLDLTASDIFISNIHSIEPNSTKATGKKIATIENTKLIGDVRRNCQLGIFGTYSMIYKDDLKEYETGKPQVGTAYILTTLTDNTAQSYEIEIEKINANGNHDIVLEIIDQNLLNITNGIVPGMSGSPIIQDGKIVGAVTHVLVNDPTRGYGIFIENMLYAAK